jgi:two-component system CheB/CheR fusion protein
MAEDLSLRELIHILADERRLDLRGYKHSTLERRIRKRMVQVSASGFSDYLQRVREQPEEINHLLNAILINVTEFFRDPQAWEALAQKALPMLLGQMKAGDSLRAWSAGCASGEEPYSLAILIADYLGARAGDFDIKIYATDIDEDALNVARRAEYPLERLRRVRPEWRQRYFAGANPLRLVREVRRMVIFGHTNVASNAPISHCQIVLCRNLLIYFDTAMQRRILSRLHYALQPGGILFLGKAESKLDELQTFLVLDSRWRIFQKTSSQVQQDEERVPAAAEEAPVDNSKRQHELKVLRLYQRHMLETVRPGVLALDENDVITSTNEGATRIFDIPAARLNGRRLQNTELLIRCPELQAGLEESRRRPEQVDLHCRIRVGVEERVFAITLRAVSDGGQRAGTVIYLEDISDRERLQSTVEQLESTTEELQSANEELETTNEELQSTNEELETTNEELQSTNEELETTNEELQSLNEELENMNEELGARTRELNVLSSRYAETLRSMPWPVMVVDNQQRVQLWNSGAQKLFGIGETSVTGVALDRLPMNSELRETMVRLCRGVLGRKRSTYLRNQQFNTRKFKAAFDVHFTPIAGDQEQIEGVLILFGPLQNEPEKPARPRPQPGAKRNRKSEKRKR